MSLFNSKKFTGLQIVFVSVIIIAATFYLTSFWDKLQYEAEANTFKNTNTRSYNIKRITGLKFVKPILWVDENCESENLSGIKQRITEILEYYKQTQGVTNASVYLRSSGEWTIVNESEKYDPASLFKVPVMIAILKTEEDHPGFLDKVVTYNENKELDKNLAFPPSKSIQLGKNYTIRELLRYMIKYSDNAATELLERNMKTETLQKLFSDIGVEVPNPYANQYQLTVRDFSLFIRIIFNAGYLNVKNSEYAAELLSECDFKEGLAKGLPTHTKMAHKFGEAGSLNEKQLHESVVVFLDNRNYLLTVMTKGNDIKKLSNLMGDISRAVYSDLNANPTNF